jgi:hypothetical protein
MLRLKTAALLAALALPIVGVLAARPATAMMPVSDPLPLHPATAPPVVFTPDLCAGDVQTSADATPTALTPLALAMPPTALMGQFGAPIPLTNEAMVELTPWGYRYMAGQQSSHLTITCTDNTLHFVDTGTASIRSLATGCTSSPVAVGISISCVMPTAFATTDMYLQIWPRLGNDFVDGHTLSSRFRMWDLADGGNDTMLGGAGDDFFNGAFQNDTAYGNGGNDWLRGGTGDDHLYGGTGTNRIAEN